jgi:hypothetical protein
VDFFNLPNLSFRNMALKSTQTLTEMSTRNLPGGKGQPARKADKLNIIYEQTVWKMWEPRPLTPFMGLQGLLKGQLYLYIIFRFSPYCALKSRAMDGSS